MEGLPPEGGQGCLRLRAEVAGLGLEVGAVDGIAQQGMPDMGEVHPDLMGAPGLELAGEQRGDRLLVTLDIGGATEIRSFDAKTLKPAGKLKFVSEP